MIDLCDFWHVAKRRSHQAIQRIYISVRQQKLEIKNIIKDIIAHTYVTLVHKNYYNAQISDMLLKACKAPSTERLKPTKRLLRGGVGTPVTFWDRLMEGTN